MNWRLSVRERAKTDVRRAAAWYESQAAGLGDDFVSCVSNAIANLQLNPYICQIHYRTFRQLLPDRFPYRIFYIIEGEKIVIF